jgi:hypothetical protein
LKVTLTKDNKATRRERKQSTAMLSKWQQGKAKQGREKHSKAKQSEAKQQRAKQGKAKQRI